MVAVAASAEETYMRRRLSESNPSQNYVFYAIIALIFLICGIYNMCFKKRLEAELMRQQVYHEQTYRQDIIASDEDMDNTWECDVCVFKNYQTQKVCMLCGTDRGYRLFGKKDNSYVSASTPRSKSESRRRLNTLNTRQLGARRRNDWVREVDQETGELIWKRNDKVDDYRILRTSSATMERDSINSNASGRSVGYISRLVMTPKHPDGRMSFELAEGSAAPRSNGSLPIQQGELDQVASLTFQQKQAWFVQHTASMELPWESGHMMLEVDRKNLLHNSCEQLLWATRDQLHQPLRIKFAGEPGVDAGGLEREWFTLMGHGIFSDETGLFKNTDTGYFINDRSLDASDDHLMYFQAIGRFLGRAIFEGVLMEAHLALPLYKHILGIPITFSDLQFIDHEVFRSLKWMKENENVDVLELDFSVMAVRLDGQLEVVDLIPNGRNIPVTDENKKQYIQEKLKWVMVTSISEQLAALIQGIFSVVPKELLSVFDHQELELLMCGIPEINVEDWRKNTQYITASNGDVIEWFWKTVEGFTCEQRARLLQFTTGSARVPVQGFKALTMNDGRICLFTIQVIPQAECMYPRAHTCFNRLDLPAFSNESDVVDALTMVINMEVTGFTME